MASSGSGTNYVVLSLFWKEQQQQKSNMFKIIFFVSLFWKEQKQQKSNMFKKVFFKMVFCYTFCFNLPDWPGGGWEVGENGRVIEMVPMYM